MSTFHQPGGGGNMGNNDNVNINIVNIVYGKLYLLMFI